MNYLIFKDRQLTVFCFKGLINQLYIVALTQVNPDLNSNWVPICCEIST